MTATIFAVANCPARGTATEPLTVSDLVSITNFPGLTRSIAISPDGAVVAYVTETNTTDSNLLPDDWPNWGRRQLWLQKLLGGPPIRIDVPEGFEPARGPGLGWSPDGQVLVVYAHANHRGRIAAVDRDTRAVRILDVPVDPMGFDNICWWHHIQWMPEGRWFLVKRSSEDRLTAMRRTQTSKSAVAEYTSPAETDTTKSGRGAEGDTVNSGDRTDLVMVDVHTGAVKSVQKVNKLGDLSELLSPDGKKLLYVVETGPAIDDLNRYSIYVADVASGSTQMVAPDVIMSSWAQYPSWSRDSSKIAFVGNLKSDPAKLNGNQGFSGRCFVVDLRHPGAPEQVGGLEFAHTQLIRWSIDDSTLYATISNHGVQAISLATGKSESLLGGGLSEATLFDEGQGFGIFTKTNEGVTRIYQIDDRSHRAHLVFEDLKEILHVPVFSRDASHMVWVQEDISHPEDVWVGNSDFSATRQLTHVNPQIESKSLSSQQESVTWASRTGETFFGMVLLPAGYERGKRYPTLVYLYPGEANGKNLRARFGMQGTQSVGAYLNLALYASRGYAVFVPDSSLRIGHPMQDIADEVLPGVDRIVEKGIADPEKLGVFGFSYGGYGAFALITQTSRFKAAISMSGVADLITGTYRMGKDGGDYVDWGERGQGRMGGSLWQYRDRYIENSPLFYFDRVETPILIQYGADDEAALPFAPRIAFSALRSLKKTAMLVGYQGEGHTLAKSENEIDFFSRAISWFDKYMKGDNAPKSLSTKSPSLQ